MTLPVAWRIDAGIGDNFMRLHLPHARQLFRLARENRCHLEGYYFGANAPTLAALYEPMVHGLHRVQNEQQFYAESPPRSAEWAPSQDLGPCPLDFCWSQKERELASQIQQQVPRPHLIIQQSGGPHNGPEGQRRKQYSLNRYGELIGRWEATYGGGAIEFGPHSDLALPCASDLRVATLLARSADLLLGPDSALKYLGPLFNQRAVVLWSQVDRWAVDEQWAAWYGPFDRANQGLQHVLGVGNREANQTPVDEVWESIQALMEKPRGRRKIAIATATCERLILLQKMLSDAVNTVWPEDVDWTWFISDDASSEQVYSLLAQYQPHLEQAIRGPVKMWRNPQRLGCDYNVTKVINEAMSTGADWVLTLDSDMTMHPEWAVRSMELLDWAEENQGEKPLLAFSPYNSMMHAPFGNYCPGAVEKTTIGGPCTFFKGNVLRDMQLHTKVTPRWGNGVPGWDWQYTDEIKKRGGTIACLSPSFVQHLGKVGAHSTGRGIHDHAPDFILNQ